MAQISRPFQGETTGDAGNYSAAQWRRVWFHMINKNLVNNSGVLVASNNSGADEALKVTQTSPASKQVEIALGAAFVQGAFYELSDAVETLTISDNTDPDDRIDSVILRLSTILQTVRLAVLEGTPDPAPVAPTLTQTSTVWEIRLADIDVASSFSTILDADITDERSSANLQYPQEGGTGIAGGYVAGDMLIADGVDSLATINLADGHIPVGDGTDVESIDHRLIIAYPSSPLSGNQIVALVPLDTLDDPTGYASLSATSNKINLAVGRYHVIANITANPSTSNNPRLFVKYNGTVVLGNGHSGTGFSAGFGGWTSVSGEEFEVTDATHDIEFEVTLPDVRPGSGSITGQALLFRRIS